LGKLIKKVIGEGLQYQSIASNFIHLNQLSVLNYGYRYYLYLPYLFRLDQKPSKSTLAFDITQFFPLLNYQLFLLILNKDGFDSRILSFFSNYLIDRKT